MNTFKKYFSIILLLELFFSYAPAYAQTYSGPQTQIETYLCAPGKVSQSQTNLTSGATIMGQTGFQQYAATNNTNGGDLFRCINQIYKLAIALASVIGVFFIVIAGYLYIDPGNGESVEKAKSILQSTIASLVILFAGYLLLKTINPDLIQFQSIQPPSVVLPAATPPSSTGGTGVATPPSSGATGQGTVNTNTSCNQSFGNSPSAGCSTASACTDVSGYTSTHDCSSNGGICLLSPQAAQKALALITAFNNANTGCTLKISAAIEGNTGPSSSSCHYLGNSNSGTCADFNVIGYNSTCAQAFYNAAQQAGVVSFQDEYVSSCVAPSTTGGNIHVNF